jgi:calcineurin-like phosphoesterase family protein
MNSKLVKNWNSVVRSEDIVYILGDIAMIGKSQEEKLGQIIQKLRGTKILIMGNHDEMSQKQYIRIGFQQVVYPYLEVKEGWYCYHDPALATAIGEKAKINLVGHVHDLFDIIPAKRMINVGVDIWDYKPISEEQINTIIEGWKNAL